MQSVSAFDLPLTGTNVHLRRLQPEDALPLYEIEADADVKRYIGGPVLKPQATWISDLEKSLKDTHLLAITLGESGPLLGRASLDPVISSNELELRIVLGRNAWGKHYGREAAGLLLKHADNLHCPLVAIADPRNQASLALLQAIGFNQIDIVQSNDWQNGHLLFRRNPDGLL